MKILLFCTILHQVLFAVNGHLYSDYDFYYDVPPPPPPPLPDTFSTDSQPKLAILYDAMETNSQEFFKTNLIKQFSYFSPYIDIKLVPCIQAESGPLGFVCPSAVDRNCLTNKSHCCAIDKVTDKTQLINYLACTMNGVNKLPDFSTCATQNRVNGNDIQTCANSETGKGLCRYYSGKKIKDNKDKMPLFYFYKLDDIRTTDKLEKINYYRYRICQDDLYWAICAKLIASGASKIPDDCKRKLVLGIFYKVMDEKSQKWFHTLGSIFDDFSDYFVFKFQPCMFAEVSKDGRIDCKDANDKNCEGARTHACAIKHSTDPKSLYHFLNCTMQDPKITPNYQKCATDNNLQYDFMKKCVDNDGVSLCIDSANTRPADTIPAFSFELTFNGDTSKKTSNATDLKSILCEQLKKYKVACPKDCH